MALLTGTCWAQSGWCASALCDCPFSDVPEDANPVVAQHGIRRHTADVCLAHIQGVYIGNKGIGQVFGKFGLELLVIRKTLGVIKMCIRDRPEPSPNGGTGEPSISAKQPLSRPV